MSDEAQDPAPESATPSNLAARDAKTRAALEAYGLSAEDYKGPTRWRTVSESNAIEAQALLAQCQHAITRGELGIAAGACHEAAAKLRTAAAFDYVDRTERRRSEEPPVAHPPCETGAGPRCCLSDGHPGVHRYKCASALCPGLTWPASTSPHHKCAQAVANEETS